MTRAEAHATTTEHQLGNDAEARFAEWLATDGIAEQRANVHRVAARFYAGKRPPGRNARATVVNSQRRLNTDK